MPAKTNSGRVAYKAAMRLTYRPAVESDLAQLYDIRFSVEENRSCDPAEIPVSRVLPVLKEGGSFLCLDGGWPVGFSMASFELGELFGLFLRPGYQGCGIGRRLLGLATEWMRHQGAAGMRLVTDPGTRAERLYLAAGWQATGRNEDTGEVLLELRLNP
jgi:GNAT superfamily N-acetyltransferase